MVDSECVFKDTRFLEVYSTKYVLKNNNMPEQITMFLSIFITFFKYSF
jgi:hypothetical protein